LATTQTTPHKPSPAVPAATPDGARRYGAARDLDVPPFRPSRVWVSRDLQTVRNFIRRPRHDLRPWAEQHVWLDVAGGDRLAAHLHACERMPERPLVVLIHGLTGCADSHYVRASAHAWLTAGFPVCRLNLRGSLPSRPACRGHYHAGRSADIADALTGLIAHRPALSRVGVIPVGFSLGGNMLIKFLAETGRRYPVRAAVTVSAPIDLAATSRRFHQRRNAIYHRWLLQRLKMEATQPPAALSADERAAIAAARSVYAFDDGFVAPRHGFRDAHDYYARCSGMRFLDHVAVPFLALHADDDPWIPAQAYHAFHWSRNAAIGAVVPARGGHVGFHARDSVVPWHNRAMIAFARGLGS
jgi:predicted alpha/beta-fold hydrolase